MGYNQPLARILGRIQQISPVSVDDYEDDGEWFLLESDTFEDPQLFAILDHQWHSIVGPNAASFRLFHCQGGRDAGVWLHYLEAAPDPADYLAGRHTIPYW